MKFKTLTALLLGATLSLSLSSCETGFVHVKEEQLNRIAMPVFMLKRDIPSDETKMLAYERVHDSLKVAQIYLEDSRIFAEGFSPAKLNPKIYSSKAPNNPLAIRLAAQDKSSNVIYLTPPCQYARRALLTDSEGNRCIHKYYTNGPVSAELVKAYHGALDNIRRYHGVDAFVLNGFGSGASVAAILASQRVDVEGLRTVAGRLDTADYAELKADVHFDGGLNPVDHAKTLAHLPQYHFIGEKDSDEVVKLYHNFAQAVGPSWCMRHSIIPNAKTYKGWVEQWPDLVALPLDCRADKQNGTAEPEVDLTPVPFNPKTLDMMDDIHGRGKK